MTVGTAMQSAALRLVGQRPSAMFGGSGALEAELCDLVNEVAADVAKYHDWQALVRIGTITGDGTASSFALPADYDRMMLGSSVTDPNTWFWGFYAFTDINAFMLAEASGFNTYPGGWIIYGNEMRFSPVPIAAQEANFPYISNNWAIAASTTPKAAFSVDTDTFALPERLLTLGLVWRWREQKKLDASGDQEAFIKALDEYASKDKGSRVIRRNSRSPLPGVRVGWPWELGPATYGF